ncbi:membrane fusion protein, multidrug efflux system [Faunimonas pinastri]|uniref:Membrane fusion protein, multidrug efflux system n=1 Tax=Faunimonas pinastri TaxID=1855383 RepID=A0A1H9NB07_9HYPH|nr:efflux RND transporter periplasmic adaptor subunit [Faunimonas pinastri]SER32927.1 membrane fusion protein, multidrug efflux system [Faunimonas pinastri]
MTDEPRSRKIVRWGLPLGVLVLAVGGYFGWSHFHGKSGQGDQQAQSGQGGGSGGGKKAGKGGGGKDDASAQSVPVTVSAVSTKDFPVYFDGIGTVQAYNSVAVRSRVDGQIEKLAFSEGQIVQQNDVLVQIDARTFQAALDQARAKLAQDQANLGNAQRDLSRYQELAKSDDASRKQVDTQFATVNQLKAQVDADTASADSAAIQLSYTTIRAPITGRVGFRGVDRGNIVHATDTDGILTIAQIQPISVLFTMPEDQLPAIDKAMTAGAVPVTALSSDGRETLGQGKLEVINNQVDTSSGTIQIKATFENKDRALWPGLSVNVRVLVQTLRNVAVIPEGAVQHGPDGLFAFLVGDDNKARRQPIKVRQQGEGEAVLDGGLKPGQRVVTDGQYRVKDGAPVQPKDAETKTAENDSPGGAGNKQQAAPAPKAE